MADETPRKLTIDSEMPPGPPPFGPPAANPSSLAADVSNVIAEYGSVPTLDGLQNSIAAS